MSKFITILFALMGCTLFAESSYPIDESQLERSMFDPSKIAEYNVHISPHPKNRLLKKGDPFYYGGEEFIVKEIEGNNLVLVKKK